MSGPKDEDGLTPKQAAFARAYFECGNALEAYRKSYDVEPNARDSWIYVEAAQMLDHPKIALKLAELRKEADSTSIYNLTIANEELEAARKLAMQEKQVGAAVAAIAQKSKLFGLDKPARVLHGNDPDNPLPAQQVTVYQLPDNGRDG